MEHVVPFAQVLEEKLGGFRTPEPSVRLPRGLPVGPTLGFFHFKSDPVAPAVRFRAAVWVPPAAPPIRPRRTLSASEQQALDALAQLGANIGADFTAESLRSAFRLLARRCHPDRHPASSEQERARQSALFAQLHDAYRHLQAVASANQPRGSAP